MNIAHGFHPQISLNKHNKIRTRVHTTSIQSSSLTSTTSTSTIDSLPKFAHLFM